MSNPAIDIRTARKSERDDLAALLQDYLSGFAEFETVEQNEDGSYRYPFLDHYWGDPNRYPFLFRVDDSLAGFALLRFDADPVSGREMMDLAEFYIAPSFRRLGLGSTAAKKLWNLFPGRWAVRVLRSNKTAYPFWKQAIKDYTGGSFDEQPPPSAIGGSYTFVFNSLSSPDMPDNVEQDSLDF